MRLLVVSHACVTPINQDFFAEVERQTGWAVTLVAPETWRGEYGVRRLERWPAFRGDLRGVPVVGSGSVPLHVYRSAFVGLFRHLRPDALYVQHEPYGVATLQLYLANRLTVRCPAGFFTWQNIHKDYPPPFAQAERFVLRASRFACAGSESAAAVLRAKGYDGDVTLVPGSIDTAHYRPAPPESVAALRASLGVDPAATLIGYAGRLVEEKGLLTLMDALGTLDVPGAPPWACVFVGEGPLEAELRARAQPFGERVRFVPYVPHPEMPGVLSAFDLLVIPSESRPNWKEQFGRVIIEALACGTAVVGSDSGEIPFLIQRTGGGWTFREGQPDALAAALAEATTAPAERARRAASGQAHVREHFGTASVAARFADAVERSRSAA